ncbi:MAG TPA: cell division protein ZapE [Actinospica sp.]|nr:cell division protein ZapE [Actinospica sp.]
MTIAERGYANSLTERRPVVSADRLISELVPPPRFAHARFGTYIPDAAEPSQSAARDLLAERAVAWSGGASAGGGGRGIRGLLRRSGPASGEGRGVYLDGGYGVGKTHLLASLWHETEGPKVYGTFVEYTNLVGALGFGPTVAHLATQRLVCIDEFELDDPGDTVLVSTLLTRLAEAGVQLAATSNTLPGQLGEGRFAAADFLREIQGLSARFTAVRIDGRDYRRRDGASAPDPLADAVVRGYVDAAGQGRFVDDFDALVKHLSTLHPSRYGALLDGVDALGMLDMGPIEDQNAALRFVVFVDRLYDRSIPVLASGVAADRLFTPELLGGGYRKKYLRAVSRLISLTKAGAALVG